MATKELRYKGKTGFAGIAIGNIQCIQSNQIIIRPEETNIDIDFQQNIIKNAFQNALNEVLERISFLRTHSENNDALDVFTVHSEILKDRMFLEDILRTTDTQRCSAATAIRFVTEKYITEFQRKSSPVFQDKAWDIEDIQSLLLNFAEKEANEEKTIPEIFWTKKITPHQVFELKRHSVKGFALQISSHTAHEMIIAKALQIPCLYNVNKPNISGLTPALMDSHRGLLVINPGEHTLSKYNTDNTQYFIGNSVFQNKKKLRESFNKIPEKFTMSCGRHIHMQVNIDFPEELTHFPRNKISEIGLCRTEFLFHDALKIDKKSQQKVYEKIVQYIHPKPVNFRLFDLNEEKTLPCINPEKMKKTGLNSIRYLLFEKSLLEDQIYALINSGDQETIKILIPMISLVDEVLQVKEIIHSVCAKLNKNLPLIGAMIETPAAIYLMPTLNHEVDFYSVGTNDLLQFLTATNRGNIWQKHIYNPFHEALFAALEQILESAQGLPVAICGESAAKLPSLLAFIGLGYTHFSVSPVNLPDINEKLSKFSFEFAQELVLNIRKLQNPQEREAKITQILQKIVK